MSAGRRVLFLVDGLASGGLERQLALLATSLPLGWRPLVWSAGGGPFLNVLRDAGVPVIVDRRRARLDPRPFARLARLIACRRPDIVHGWNWMPASVAAPVCRAAGIPYVDGTIRLGRPNPEFGRPRRSVMFLASTVVANSQAGLDAWGVRAPKGRVIYNAFDSGRLATLATVTASGSANGKAGRPFTAVMTGRMHKHKDFASVLTAARILASSTPAGTWRFLLVGDGPRRADLEREAADLTQAGVVDFVAPGLEVLPIVAGADVGVLMTDDALHAEGCSNSIMEYMACGLPVVCCDSGGNRELVTEGVSGLLVGSGDAAGLARRLEELRVSLRGATMGAVGRERLLHEFTVARMVDSYRDVYRACLGERDQRMV